MPSDTIVADRSCMLSSIVPSALCASLNCVSLSGPKRYTAQIHLVDFAITVVVSATTVVAPKKWVCINKNKNRKKLLGSSIKRV